LSGSRPRIAAPRPAHHIGVAGFTRDQLDVTVEENQLVIRGRHHDQDPGKISPRHRGTPIPAHIRAGDGMEVLGPTS